ncbi:cell separation during budding [Mitosporidium daphniae]
MLDYVDLADFLLHKGVDGLQLEATARTLVDRSMKDPFYSTGIDSPILNAIEVLGMGIHRIVLMNDAISKTDIPKPSERICGVLSQSDLLRWILKEQQGKRDNDFLLPLSHLIKITYPAVSVNPSELLIEAIRKMRVNSVSSVAVVEKNNLIVGHLSASDLQYLIFKKDPKSFLFQPVLPFISMVLSEIGISRGGDRYPYYDVYEDTPLINVIEKLLATSTHRVWVVENPATSPNRAGSAHPKLLGVVSMTDIIDGVFKPKSGHEY